MAPKRESGKLVAENRKARFNYRDRGQARGRHRADRLGGEVAARRQGQYRRSYASERGGGELYLINAHIAEYAQAGRNSHEPTRPRKLLLHQQASSAGWRARSSGEGMTVVPLKLYFNARGIAKVELGLAKGKKLHDKRETEKKRDWERQKGRLMRDKG